MRIHKVNENKLEIFIGVNDLEANDININQFMSSSSKRYNFLLDIVKYSSKEVGFNFKNCKIILESFSIPSINSFIITITRIPYKVHKSKYKNLKINTYFLAKFKSFDTICAFCKSINIDVISYLYFYKDFYYLNIRINHISEFKKIILCLKEFTKDYKINFFIDENANLIVRNNAIEFCKIFAEE